MATNIVVPQLGESIIEATVSHWRKKPGERVAAGEAVVELETEKVNLEVGAEKAGVLARIDKPEGQDVRIGEVLGVIDEAAPAQQTTPQPGTGVSEPTTPPASAPQSAAPPSPSGKDSGAPQPNAQSGQAAKESSTQQATAPQPAAQRGTAGTEPAAKRASTTQPTESADQPAAAQPTESADQPAAAQPTESADQPATPAEGAAPDADIDSGERVTPVARRLAEDQGVDLAQVRPSGSAGRVTKRDVQVFLEQRQADPTPVADTAQAPLAEAAASDEAAPAKEAQPNLEPISPATAAGVDGARREEHVRLSRRRRTIARRLVEAQQTAAMLTTFNEIDLTAVIDIRRRRKESFKEKHGIGLGFMSFFVKASLGALKAFPVLNAELQDDEIVLKHYYDIGVAIGAEEGLVVPVLRDADRLSFAEIEKSIDAFVQKARGGALSLDDLRGGTFTITNGGVFGSLLSTPILNPPQVGILGLHKIEERPVARGGEVVVRSMMYVALTYDHRLVDGREAVQFLVRVKELIEDPETMLIEG